jgi:hypothetical protein
MRPPRPWLVGVAALLTSAALAEDHLAQVVDHALLAATHAAPVVRLLSDSATERETGRRLTDALLISAALAEALKLTVSSPRPNGGDDDGFPSYHTAAACAVAMTLTEREGEIGWAAFPLAALAGYARVDLDEHTWGQVLAGAALGTFVGHMCGTGQWRLFGHADVEATSQPLSLSAAPRTVGGGEAQVPPALGRGLDWGTTVWHTRF